MDRANLLESFILRDVTVTGKELGKGAFARAFEVEYGGATYAGKELVSSVVDGVDARIRDTLKNHVLNECYLLSRNDHPNVIKFIGIFYNAQALIPNVVIEKMDCDLMTLAMRNKPFPLHKMLSLLYDVSLAVCYLHNQTPPILHRDLTAISVLVNNTATVAKISDFLFATTLPIGKEDSRKDFWQCAYTLRDHPGVMLPPVFDYLPPEMFTNRQEYGESVFADGSAYGLPVDVFCFGVLVVCAVIGDWPKPNEVVVVTSKDGVEVSRTLSEVERRQQYLDKMIGETEVLRPLVEECLVNDPVMRPIIATVCERINEIRETYRQQYSES